MRSLMFGTVDFYVTDGLSLGPYTQLPFYRPERPRTPVLPPHTAQVLG